MERFIELLCVHSRPVAVSNTRDSLNKFSFTFTRECHSSTLVCWFCFFIIKNTRKRVF